MGRLDEIIDEAMSYGIESANSDPSQERLQVDKDVIADSTRDIKALIKAQIHPGYGLFDSAATPEAVLKWVEKQVDDL